MKTILLILLFTFSCGAIESVEETTRPITNCQVMKWGTHQTSGGRCLFSDEVMTGIISVDPLIVQCSMLRVTCRENDKESDSTH